MTECLFLCWTLLLIIVVAGLLFVCYGPAPVKPKQPIEYPLEPMFENYIDIIEAITHSTEEKELNNIYGRIIIFEGCYPEAATFISELKDAYKAKCTEAS